MKYITFKIICNKFTVGFMISLLVSFALAIGIRYLIEFYTNVTPVRGGLESVDLCFFGLVVVIRFIIVILIEQLLGDTYNTPIFMGNSITDDIHINANDNKNTLKMINKDSSSDKNVSKTDTGIGSSSSDVYRHRGNAPKHDPTSSTTWPRDKDREIDTKRDETSRPTENKMLTIDETLELKEEFRKNLDTQADMVKRLRKLKELKDLKYHLDKNGGLDLSAPSNISEEEFQDLINRIGVMDRIINTKSAEYGKLEGKDLMSNNSDLSTAYSKYRNFIKEQYNNLFDKE